MTIGFFIRAPGLPAPEADRRGHWTMNRRPKILAVGSLNMDVITSTRIFPGSGASVLGETFSTAPGGKGANQAVQAARLGAEVTMVGKTGQDGFGDALIASLQAAGVSTRYVLRDAKASCGVSNIILEIAPDGSRSNRIIAVPGANMTLTPEDVAFLKEEIAAYDMVMLQFEIPMAVNEQVAAFAKAKGVPVMINPAPAAAIPQGLLACAAYISPNEHEAAAITGQSIRVEGGLHLEDIRAVADIMRSRGTQNLLVTLGENGAAIGGEGGVEHVPAVPGVKAVDPTAAGDSFVAAFCTGLCAGLSQRQAIDFARNAAAITVSRPGAQPSLPSLEEVLAGMKLHGEKDFPYQLLDCLKG